MRTPRVLMVLQPVVEDPVALHATEGTGVEELAEGPEPRLLPGQACSMGYERTPDSRSSGEARRIS